MYGGSWYPNPSDPRGPRYRKLSDERWVPTINLSENNNTPSSSSNEMLSTIAQSFQATIANLVAQASTEKAQTAQVVAQTVATAITQAQNEQKERDMRLMLQLQRETIEEAHQKELKKLAIENDKLKRERTERAEDFLCHFFL